MHTSAQISAPLPAFSLSSPFHPPGLTLTLTFPHQVVQIVEANSVWAVCSNAPCAFGL